MEPRDSYPPPPVRAYVVRHGETNENRQGIIQGQLDTKLNAAGVAQAKCVARALKDVPFVAAMSSDLRRAVQTAEAILAYHPDVQVTTSAGIRERYMGELQGLVMTKERRAKLTKTAEAGEAFTQRILTWWDRTVQHAVAGLPSPRDGRDTRHVLIVSHGAWIATLVRALAARNTMDIGRDVTVGVCHNTSITTIDVFRGGRARLLRYSDISHILAAPVLETNADDQETATRTAAGAVGSDDSKEAKETQTVKIREADLQLINHVYNK